MLRFSNFSKVRLPGVLATAGLLVLSASAVSQPASIEEVVVTASKRATTLQEVPIAVSVVGADAIEKAQILDLKDLQTLVPSLRINQLQNSANTNFIIRGFGNGANNPGIEPSVGVFIDGVYRSRSAAQISDLPNLERVEVLRGPQSTLFGKNASAGVISVVTAKPTGEPAAHLSLTAGNFGQISFKGLASGSFSDNVAFELSAGSNSRDGYTQNLITGSEINGRDRQSVRGQLAIDVSDDTSVRIIADYDKIDEVCCAVTNFLTSPLEVFVNSQTGAMVNSNNPFARQVFQNQDPANQIDNSGISVQVDHDYENFTLTSITAFRNVDSFSNIDADFTSADYITNPITTNIETFTQELRLTSTSDGPLEWMVGLYYFDESIDYRNELDYGASFRPFVDALTLAAGAPNALAGIEAALGLPVGQAFFPASGAVTEVGTLENDAISLFGQLDWHISDQLTATLGLNYTRDEKEATLAQVERDAFSSLDFVQLGFGAIFQQLVGLGLPPAVAQAQATALSTTAANPFLALQPVQFLPPLQDYPNSVEDGLTDDNELTYTLRLAYDVNDSLNFYASYATGFKASSVNLSRDARPSAADFAALQAAGIAQPNLTVGSRIAGPEEATVIEIGAKYRFSHGALNVAVFDQQIEGFQSNVFGGTGFNLINAEEQSTRGVEFDLTVYPVESLQLIVAGTLLDPVYDSFTQASQGDLSGRTPAGIHHVSLSFSGAYDFAFNANWDAYIRGDYQYEDSVRTNDGIPSFVSSESTRNLNLSAGVVNQSGLSFSIWGRNLTDHETVSTAFPTVGGTEGIFGYRNQPRTFGATVAKDF